MRFLDFSAGFGISVAVVQPAPVSINDPSIPAPGTFELLQSFPNPFRSRTNICLRIKDPGRVYQLSIYNVKGQLVKNLGQSTLAKGLHTFTWDGTDGAGNKVSSGIYSCRLSDGSHTQSRRMVLMK